MHSAAACKQSRLSPGPGILLHLGDSGPVGDREPGWTSIGGNSPAYINTRCPGFTVQVPDPNPHWITGNHLVGTWPAGATSKSAHPTSSPLPPPRTSSAHTHLGCLLTSARVAIAQTSIFMTLLPRTPRSCWVCPLLSHSAVPASLPSPGCRLSVGHGTGLPARASLSGCGQWKSLTPPPTSAHVTLLNSKASRALAMPSEFLVLLRASPGLPAVPFSCPFLSHLPPGTPSLFPAP